jgi:hypothetical protein
MSLTNQNSTQHMEGTTMYLTRFEKIYIGICNLLGARIFKKYWPHGGSYWNTNHTDTKSEYDLQQISYNITYYQKVHTAGLLLETLMYAIVFGTGHTKPKKVIQCIPVSLIIHGYPLLIQKYNRILVNAHIKKIRESKIETENKDIVVKYTTLRVYNTRNDETKYTLEITNHYINLGPIFTNIERAKSFQLYITNNYNQETLFDQYYLDNCRSIYLTWKHSL